MPSFLLVEQKFVLCALLPSRQDSHRELLKKYNKPLFARMTQRGIADTAIPGVRIFSVTFRAYIRVLCRTAGDILQLVLFQRLHLFFQCFHGVCSFQMGGCRGGQHRRIPILLSLHRGLVFGERLAEYQKTNM